MNQIFAGIDVSTQSQILELFSNLLERKRIAMIFITHDIATVKAISDEVVVMNEGEVVEQGLKSEIFSPPHPEYTELLLSTVPEMDPDWLTDLLKARNL